MPNIAEHQIKSEYQMTLEWYCLLKHDGFDKDAEENHCFSGFLLSCLIPPVFT